MIVTAAFFLLALTWSTRADKKIELQDIEEDNLKNEKDKDDDPVDQRGQNAGGSARETLPLEFFKNGLLRYFESTQVQQPRYIHQYAVNEPSEKTVAVTPKPQYGPPASQQAMLGYLSNVPMQFYIVPQYYGEPNEQASNVQPGVQYAAPGVTRIAAYQTPEVVHSRANYVQVPSYIAPTGKAYAAPQYTPQIAYVTYAQQPTLAPTNTHVIAASGPADTGSQTSVAPLVAYSMPYIQYPTSLASPNVYTKSYYPQYAQHIESNSVDDAQETELENPKQYATQTEVPYTKVTSPEYPRYYTSRAPIREEHSHHPVPELPHPSPLLLRSQPSHLSGIPKALPMYRPPKPVYSAHGNLIPNVLTPRPGDIYNFPKKRPTSLLDSYIPSSVQLEYLKRGYSKDPLSIYDVLSSGRSSFSHPHVTPRYYERGFLPNQMYHTASGGITYGHYKRTPKTEKTGHK